ncbi:putative transcription factor C2H2 family [Rosa chinensis]|uniref:Putative transcription factor C2H2 family n=1 Tax=Rosa chinensis TaxID=74649 RepID=A0A2P6RB51_ROSCH|nr:zinc finger protein ZAT5 [Rosa chinensis]PRQ43659.1 putative transcription factor C2H2 family [Rosa chinensis]
MMMMMMEAANLEEDQNQMMIIKGKRTKRPRLSSPIVLTTTASSSSSPGGGDDVEDHHHQLGMISTPIRVSDQDDETTASPATSAEFTEMSTTEEEEDMANCLILLAQSGQTQIRKVQEQQQPIKAVAAADTAPGLYVYECKTCNRCFSSFQALGGHRASHKKPKASNVINTTQAQPKKELSCMEDQDEYDRRFNNNTTSTTLSLQISNRGFGNSKGNKVHECSVCGAEFSSGQALGGHMRRHRTSMNSTTTAQTLSSPQPQAPNKRPRSVLELDLNLPAPEEERLEMTKLPFSSSKKEQVIVFSASPLVGCHY